MPTRQPKRGVLRSVFIGMPLAIFGKNSFLLGNQFIGNLWATLRNPHCPECDKGVLSVDHSGDVHHESDESTHYLWRCHQCSYGVFAPNDKKVVRELVGELRKASLLSRLSTIEAKQLDDIARGHRNTSRAYYVAAFLAYLGSFYMIASGASIMTALNWAVLGTTIGSFGLIRAYRYWQVSTGNLFVEGAFLRWLRDERWFY